MGFELEETVFRLVFADPALEGLEVVAGELAIDDFLKLSSLVDVLTADDVPVAKQAAMVGEVCGVLAANLRGWNLQRKGEPVPLTAESIRRLPITLLMKILLAWQTVLGDVEPPLPPSSNGSKPSGDLERSIPMEPLSVSRSS